MGSGHRNLAIISDCMHYTTEFVYFAQSKSMSTSLKQFSWSFLIDIITRFTKNNYPNVKHINYLSDGAGLHFENNKNILNFTYHEVDFGLPASWTFSATSHEKGPVDGIGAAIKLCATHHLLRLQKERVFLSPWAFYDFINRATDHQTTKRDLEPNRPIDVFYTPSDEVEPIHHEVLLDRRSIVRKQWIKGIQKMHQFKSTRVQYIECRETSSSVDNLEFVISR